MQLLTSEINNAINGKCISQRTKMLLPREAHRQMHTRTHGSINTYSLGSLKGTKKIEVKIIKCKTS